MKTHDSIDEIFAAAVEQTKRQALQAKINVALLDFDYEQGAKVLTTETDEIIPGFDITKREMFRAPGEYWYEVQINDGDTRKFGLYVEMLDYLRDVSDILARRICPDWEANQDA
jgi:hypothetical protein